MMQNMKKISDQASVSARTEGRQNGSVRRNWGGGGGVVSGCVQKNGSAWKGHAH